METCSLLYTALPAEKVATNSPLLSGDLLPTVEITVPSDLWFSIMGATHKLVRVSQTCSRQDELSEQRLNI